MRKEVGSMRSISLGFGNEAPESSQKRNRHYRLWELGTYSGDWQIVHDEAVLLSKDRSTNIAELDGLLQSIDIGCFVALRQLSKTDLRLDLDNGLVVNFSGNPDVDDEYFHVFCPEAQYAEFSEAGWTIGHSDEPWAKKTVPSL